MVNAGRINCDFSRLELTYSCHGFTARVEMTHLIAKGNDGSNYEPLNSDTSEAISVVLDQNLLLLATDKRRQ